MPQDFDAVISFWARSSAHWFHKNARFDQLFREAFLDMHFAAARREYEHWMSCARGTLALLILLDQFPRNAFRGTAHMYATDALARHVARVGLAQDYMVQVDAALQLFFCLPFAHSEDLVDQDLSVMLNARLGPTSLAHAEGHRDVIRRFGRFPHRNALLLRDSTPAELQFLADGGFAG